MDNLKSSFFCNTFGNSFLNDPTPTISHVELEPCRNLISLWSAEKVPLPSRCVFQSLFYIPALKEKQTKKLK